jgi:hypothetical protein
VRQSLSEATEKGRGLGLDKAGGNLNAFSPGISSKSFGQEDLDRLLLKSFVSTISDCTNVDEGTTREFIQNATAIQLGQPPEQRKGCVESNHHQSPQCIQTANEHQEELPENKDTGSQPQGGQSGGADGNGSRRPGGEF